MQTNYPFKTSIAKKNTGIYCCAYGCKSNPNYKKGGLCHKHYRRLRRFLNPVNVRYNNFRWNAKKRNIENSVTLNQFRKFCVDNQYIVKKGARGQNATIDRRCNVHGYHIWNMCVMSNVANARKGNSFKGAVFSKPKSITQQINESIDDFVYDEHDNLPF